MIREATDHDFDDIWFIFKSVVSTGTSYVYSPETTKDEAYRIWMTLPKKHLSCSTTQVRLLVRIT